VADPPLNDRRRRRGDRRRAGADGPRGLANERVSGAVDRANERVSDAVDRANERVAGAVDRANERVADAKARARELRVATKARLFGLDRSGPPPAPTQAGQPLNPWTLPNAIGYVRLALIPVFLAVALSSRHGQATVAVLLFAVIGWTDYLDGFVARLTGQFSRLGALLDPIVDRCLVISGMAVCWRFSLLPRVALALVIAREVFMLALSRYALHHKVDIKINWFGRLAVAPILGAPFFAMAGAHTVAVVLLLIGMALSLTATVAYVRVGLEHRRREAIARPSS
jgi:cardiolipin synthase